jgi:hypothetical protein
MHTIRGGIQSAQDLVHMSDVNGNGNRYFGGNKPQLPHIHPIGGGSLLG